MYVNLVCDKVDISEWWEKDELFNKMCQDTCLVIWKNKTGFVPCHSCKNSSRGQSCKYNNVNY